MNQKNMLPLQALQIADNDTHRLIQKIRGRDFYTSFCKENQSKETIITPLNAQYLEGDESNNGV